MCWPCIWHIQIQEVLAVSKHNKKLKHELQQQKMAVKLFDDAWKKIDAVNKVDGVGGEKNMDGINDKVDVGGDDGKVGVLVGDNMVRDTSMPSGVGLQVGVIDK